MAQFVAVVLNEPSQVGEARRTVAAVAEELGFDEADTGKAALLVTEAATNLLKHAGGGEVLVGTAPGAQYPTLEILALDRGRGMADVGRCLTDGYSTVGSPGTGLGALRRVASRFEIYSLPNAGTAVFLQLRRSGRETTPRGAPCALAFGGVSVSKPGEDACGDAWLAETHSQGGLAAVADGLGHGPAAAYAAREAIGVVERDHDRDVKGLLATAHVALRSTRGAAMAAADISVREGRVTFCGIGNIDGTVASRSAVRKMVSFHGTLGHEVRKISTFTYPWAEDALLILHTDGLSCHWNLDQYPGLRVCHPGLIAGILYRDFSRRRDDVTVVVAKATEQSA